MKSSASWREILPIHPAAQLLPRMTEQELRELGEDIKSRGLLQPIFILQESLGDADFRYSLLDGVNQLDAMEVVGIKFEIGHDSRCGWMLDFESHSHGELYVPVSVVVADDSDPFAFVLSVNLHRRHLTAEQRRELIAKVLKATPDRSNRQIANAVKASHVTVGAVRAELEGRGQIDHVEAHTDTKGRRQRAHKSRSISNSTVITAGDRAAAQLQARLEYAPDPRTHAAHQVDADYLIAQFTAQVRSSGLEVARQIEAACRPMLVERLHEVIDEIGLEAERWAIEARQLEEMPDIPAFLRRSAP